MVDRIQLRRTNTPAAVPTNTDLIVEGEVALNLQDKLLYFRDATGTIQSVTVADLAGFDTADLTEGTSLYFTDERVDDRVAALLVGGTGITVTYDDGAGTLTIDRDLITDAGVSASAAISADKIAVASTSPTYNTVQHLQDVFHSAGLASGGEITDAGAGQITVAAGEGLTRASATQNDVINFMNWASATLALTDNALNYVYVDNSEVVQVSTTDPSKVVNCYLGTVYRSGTTLHITNTSKYQVGDHASLMIKRLQNIMPFAHESGAAISFTNRNISVTAGTFWEGLTQFTTPAFDSSLTTFETYYTDAGGNWIQGTANLIDNTNYDGTGAGLVAVSGPRYGVHWIYLDPEGEVYSVYGVGDYTLSEAESVGIRADLPPFFEKHARLIGKVIIGSADAAITEAQSVFTTTFSGSAATDHGNLTGLLDDDHTQYHNDTRGDVRYPLLTGTNTITGTNTFSGTVNFTTTGINALADVDTVTSAPIDGEQLTWSAAGSEWVPNAVPTFAGGEGAAAGLVPATPGFGTSAAMYLRLDGTWAFLPGVQLGVYEDGIIAGPPAGTPIIDFYGAGVSVADVAGNAEITIRDTNFALAYAATLTPDAEDGTVQTVTLTGNVTFSAFTSPIAGQNIKVIIKQDATGSRILTSTMLFAGGVDTLSTAANAIDIMNVFYDGTTYYATLDKGFV